MCASIYSLLYPSKNLSIILKKDHICQFFYIIYTFLESIFEQCYAQCYKEVFCFKVLWCSSLMVWMGGRVAGCTINPFLIKCWNLTCSSQFYNLGRLLPSERGNFVEGYCTNIRFVDPDKTFWIGSVWHSFELIKIPSTGASYATALVKTTSSLFSI